MFIKSKRCGELPHNFPFKKNAEDYCSVIAHYVNADWQLEKRIIGLRMIDVSYNANNIAELIACVVANFGLTNKIYSVALNNAAANTRVINELSLILSSYVGTLFLHQRCAYHIINLIVKAVLELFKPILSAFRIVV